MPQGVHPSCAFSSDTSAGRSAFRAASVGPRHRDPCPIGRLADPPFLAVEQWTAVHQRQNGAWKIVAAHESYTPEAAAGTTRRPCAPRLSVDGHRRVVEDTWNWPLR